SLMEKEYINSYNYFNEFVDLYEEIKDDKKNYYEKREKTILKLEDKIRNLEKFYKTSHSDLKAGRLKTFKEFWTVLKNDTRKMIKEIEEEKNKNIRVKLKILIVIIGFFTIGFFGVLIRWSIKYFILKNKKKT
ncbi:MAG: hypothetical protein ACFFDN_16820, partial [Candidatus Hodarchaeota archaeon]